MYNFGYIPCCKIAICVYTPYTCQDIRHVYTNLSSFLLQFSTKVYKNLYKIISKNLPKNVRKLYHFGEVHQSLMIFWWKNLYIIKATLYHLYTGGFFYAFVLQAICRLVVEFFLLYEWFCMS